MSSPSKSSPARSPYLQTDYKDLFGSIKVIGADNEVCNSSDDSEKVKGLKEGVKKGHPNVNLSPLQIPVEESFGHGQVVFVDPLDTHAKYWWPAMIVPPAEIDVSMGIDKVETDERLVKYFEDSTYSKVNENELTMFHLKCPHYIKFSTGPYKHEFLTDTGVKMAVEYLETGVLPDKFKWQFYGSKDTSPLLSASAFAGRNKHPLIRKAKDITKRDISHQKTIHVEKMVDNTIEEILEETKEKIELGFQLYNSLQKTIRKLGRETSIRKVIGETKGKGGRGSRRIITKGLKREVQEDSEETEDESSESESIMEGEDEKDNLKRLRDFLEDKVERSQKLRRVFDNIFDGHDVSSNSNLEKS